MLLFAIFVTAATTWCVVSAWRDVDREVLPFRSPTAVKAALYVMYVSCLLCAWVLYFVSRGGPWIETH